MIIYDKRKDYYDCIQRTGQDKTCQYFRKEEKIYLKDIKLNYDTSDILRGSTQFVIGFCGELYPCVYLTHHYHNEILNEEYIYSSAKLIKWAEKHNLKTKSEYKFFDKDNEKYRFLNKYFTTYKTPIFYISINYFYGFNDHKLIINPLLQDFDFQKVVDPYQAFQRIHNYISGVLGQEAKPIPKITDEVKAEIHGFDKNSFRIPKGTKPNRKG